MPAHQSRLVRVMSEEQIVGITGTLPYATSIGRNWTGVEVHRYRVSGPSDTKAFSLPQLAVFLPRLDQPCRVRQEVGDHTMIKDVTHDAVTIAPATLPRRAWIERPHELTATFSTLSSSARSRAVKRGTTIPRSFRSSASPTR